MSGSPEDNRMESYVRLVEQVQQLHSDDPASFIEAIRDAARMFDELRVPYAIIGALAVAAYVEERRTTEDIDVVTDAADKERVLTHAHEYGFLDHTRESESPIHRLRHKSGVALDIIFNAHGFADLATTREVRMGAAGRVRVASRVDIAYAKLLTQDSTLGRPKVKMLVDMSDLVALLRSDPSLSQELLRRMGIRASARPVPADVDRRNVLLAACANAGVPLPMEKTSSPAVQFVVVAAVLVAVLAAFATLAWLVEGFEQVERWAIFVGGILVLVPTATVMRRITRSRRGRGEANGIDSANEASRRRER